MDEYFLRSPELSKGLRPKQVEFPNTGYAVHAANMEPQVNSLNRVLWPSMWTGLDLSGEAWPEISLHKVQDGHVVLGDETCYRSWGSPTTISMLGTGRKTLGEVGNYIVVAQAGAQFMLGAISGGTWESLQRAENVVPGYDGKDISRTYRWCPRYVNCVSDYRGQCYIYGGVKDSRIDDGGYGNVFAWSKPMSPEIGMVERRNVAPDGTQNGFKDPAFDYRNNGGWLFVDRVGEIRDVKALGHHIAVFGERGVAQLRSWREPGWGQFLMSDVGVKCTGAVAGDAKTLFYVDAKGFLWKWTIEAMERLDYSEFLSSIDNPRLTYDEYRQFLYISGEDSHYIYDATLNVMTGPNDSDAQVRGKLGVSKNLTEVGPSLYISDVLDMKRVGYKTVRWLQPFGTIPNDTVMGVDYRYDMNAGFTRTPLRTTVPHNSVYIGVTAPEQRVVLQSSDSSLRLQDVQIRWQPADKRFHRGLSASNQQAES